MSPVTPLLLWSLSQTGTATVAERELTTDVREEREAPLDLGRLLLNLPGAFVELAFVPLMPVMVAFERWHLFERIFDLLTNEEQTLAVLPLIDPLNRSGLGLGAAIVHNEPLGSRDRTVLLGIVRANEDIDSSISIARRIPRLSGRVVSFKAKYAVDRDTRFYGLGGGGDKEDVRLIRTDAVDLRAGIDLLGPASYVFRLNLEAAYRRRRLTDGSGDDPSLLSDDVLARPPGFGRALDYPELTLELSYDTRDSGSRTTTGVIALLEASATHDVNGGNTGGVRTTASVGAFFELLPLNRVLFLNAGVAAAVPIRGEDEIPLHHLVNLGGSSILRGYKSDRFIDRLGWWTSAEYRWLFYEYGASGYGVSATLFADVGRVGRNPSDLIKGPIAWSVGVGLRLEHSLFLLSRIQLAGGPEGVRVSLGFGEVL
jgi:hypothetical protein